MNLHVPSVLQQQQQQQQLAQGTEMNRLAQNTQQRDMIPLDNKANCLLSQEESIQENKEVM